MADNDKSSTEIEGALAFIGVLGFFGIVGGIGGGMGYLFDTYIADEDGICLDTGEKYSEYLTVLREQGASDYSDLQKKLSALGVQIIEDNVRERAEKWELKKRFDIAPDDFDAQVDKFDEILEQVEYSTTKQIYLKGEFIQNPPQRYAAPKQSPLETDIDEVKRPSPSHICVDFKEWATWPLRQGIIDQQQTYDEMQQAWRSEVRATLRDMKAHLPEERQQSPSP